MRKLNLLAAVAATLLIGGTALAKDEKPAADPKEKKICKAQSDSTSRIAKKICRTAAEWADARRQNLDAASGKLGGVGRN